MEKIQNKSYQKLISYQKAKELVLAVYELTKFYPKEEFYCLVHQMRRAALSIAANIVEGYIKEKPKEYARFLTISIGPLTELEVFVEISSELKYIKKGFYNKVINLEKNKRLLCGSRKAVKLKL